MIFDSAEAQYKIIDKGEVYEITDKYVQEKLGAIVESEDSTKYIL